MKHVLMILTFAILCCTAQGQTVDTFEVRFNLNDPKLTDKSKVYIDQLLSKYKISRGQKLIILGYADHLGSENDNMTLSGKRAANVKDHLAASGYKDEEISVCIGKGEIANNTTHKAGIPDDRKVLIIIDRGKAPATTSGAKKGTPLFDISALKEDDVVPLDRVFFEAGSYKISEQSYFELSKLATFLRNNPSVHVQVEGHMCCSKLMPNDIPVADTGVNSLSGKRARAIYDFLVVNGVDAERMKYVGHGTTRPFVTPEITPDDEAKNRRVGIRVLRK